MFTKILIANRGEIACRVMETADRLGVKTVAVFSDADAGSKHVAMAGEAIRIGPAPVAESYLQGKRIIEAALESGAQAIHPGYGFLSENPDFVEQVEEAGLVFIGPSSGSIRAMGLKDAAKKLMEKAGVPVVPGYHGDQQEVSFLAKEADKIGYPVLIKARAGGGGKGMRKVERAEDFESALQGAVREGEASFGDGHVLLEKFVNSPRHVEVQVFGDNHGNAVHLFERDCSLQRRHQKVIEEAPAPGMTEDMRAAMTDAAVRAAKAIEYSGAGTIEFIVDGSGPLRPDGFWFMEMNTRLQVEHPVTEAITGVDLVEWQLRVASGEPLPVRQDALSINGHAFEARLYAEDVPKGFLPATGTLHVLEFSSRSRNDSGVRQGDTITPYYDPMIAKVITHSSSRQKALTQLELALADTRIAGTVTNTAFLRALCQNTEFVNGKMNTGLIEANLAALTDVPEPTDEIIGLAAKAALGLPILAGFREPESGVDALDVFGMLPGFSVWYSGQQEQGIIFGGIEHRVRFTSRNGVWHYSLCGQDGQWGEWQVDPETRDLDHSPDVALYAGKVAVFAPGFSYEFEIPDVGGSTGTAETGGDLIIAPMPGLVKDLKVNAGAAVRAGEPLLVLEAMKMEHTLSAPRDGKVEAVNIELNSQVEDGAVLISLEKDDG